MFTEERDSSRFTWQDLGDITMGRPNLGPFVPLTAYRLLQYTLRDVLITEFGVERADTLFVQAGRIAGIHFCRNLILDAPLSFNEFVAKLQRTLREQAIGILRVEEADLENMHFVLSVAEDLDCSGLPCTDEVVCQYDEGFIAGLLEAYTGTVFLAKEVDCWASGGRVCRFDVRELRP